MYRVAIRAAPRHIVPTKAICRNANRFISTASPAKKSRSWKSAAARWGLAGAGLYYYNTSNVFAEEPEAAIKKLDESIHHIQESSLPTVDAVMEEKRRRKAETLAEDERKRQSAEAAKVVAEEAGEETESEEGLGGLEEEAGQQGAFNPETGEINWDCPCLGGMAHGPCGDQFKEAFSCFVYSTEEPKGVECIEKFKGMQDCFRQHPEMYGSELEGDEDEIEEELRSRETASSSDDISSKPNTERTEDSSDVDAKPAETKTEKVQTEKAETKYVKPAEEPHRDSQSTTAETAQHLGDEGGELVPRATHDAASK